MFSLAAMCLPLIPWSANASSQFDARAGLKRRAMFIQPIALAPGRPRPGPFSCRAAPPNRGPHTSIPPDIASRSSACLPQLISLDNLLVHKVGGTFIIIQQLVPSSSKNVLRI